jgi:hypothetical protein
MDAIRLKHLKTNRGVAAARKTANGFDTYQNSDVPPIVPKSIHDQHTETISLSEPLLDEWNHRLKNNLQILLASWSRDTVRPATPKLARCCRMQSDASGRSEPRSGPTTARLVQPT